MKEFHEIADAPLGIRPVLLERLIRKTWSKHTGPLKNFRNAIRADYLAWCESRIPIRK